MQIISTGDRIFSIPGGAMQFVAKAPLGVAFSPSDIAGLTLWLKADAIVGMVDGDPVTTWSDQSGNGNDATQATASKKPTYKTGIQNGLPVVRFDGVANMLKNHAQNIDGYTAITLVCVARWITMPTSFGVHLGYVIMWPQDSGDVTCGWLSWDGGSGNPADTKWRLAIIGSVPPSTGYGNVALTLNMTLMDGKWSSNNANTWINGTADVVGGIGETGAMNQTGRSSPGYAIGRHMEEFGDGKLDVAEIIMYNTAISDIDRQSIESYLNAKWGVY